MRLFVSLAWLLAVPMAFGQLWYSSGCCVVTASDGVFSVISGPGVAISTSSGSVAYTSRSQDLSAGTPAAAILNGANILVVGANGDATGFVGSFPTPPTPGSVPWTKFLGTPSGTSTNMTTSLTGVAVDPDGGVWVTGSTNDPNYPVTNDAYQNTGPVSGIFSPSFGVLTKLTADGQTILYSTFFGDGISGCIGGSSCIGKVAVTQPAGVVVAADGSIVIAGTTNAPKFPVTANAIVSTLKSQYSSGFVTCFEPGGKTIRYSTFMGGSGSCRSCGRFDEIYCGGE